MVLRPLLVVGVVVVGSVTAYDKYQDALDKYAKWQQKFGVPTSVKRRERNSVDDKNVSVNNRGYVAGPIFVPHRSQEGGHQFQFSSTSTLGSLESELVSPNVIRNTRNQQNVNEIGLGGTEYISFHGTPLYKLRKRYPHYGRRKRDVETILSRKPRQSPWTLLDPATGRVIKQSPDPLQLNSFPAQQRPHRNTKHSDHYINEYITADGTPLYKLKKRNPLGYGRRRREVENSQRILHRLPRDNRKPVASSQT